MDREINTILYHKKKSSLSPKVAVEVLFLEYDSYCKYFGGPINVLNEVMYMWKR